MRGSFAEDVLKKQHTYEYFMRKKKNLLMVILMGVCCQKGRESFNPTLPEKG